MIPVFLSTKANASTASALVFENVKALRSTAAPEWQSVLEHVAYPEGEWVQVGLCIEGAEGLLWDGCPASPR
jgi:hypothetical protein